MSWLADGKMALRAASAAATVAAVEELRALPLPVGVWDATPCGGARAHGDLPMRHTPPKAHRNPVMFAHSLTWS